MLCGRAGGRAGGCAGTCPSEQVSGGWLMGFGADGRAGETDHANVCVLGYYVHRIHTKLHKYLQTNIHSYSVQNEFSLGG